MANKLEWNVYVGDFNAKQIKVHNVFNHHRLMQDIEKKIKKIKEYDEFCEALHKDLRYYYWSKCEWEVLISEFVGSKDSKPLKIDVYDQIMLNKDEFFRYVWNTLHPRKKIEE